MHINYEVCEHDGTHNCVIRQLETRHELRLVDPIRPIKIYGRVARGDGSKSVFVVYNHLRFLRVTGHTLA